MKTINLFLKQRCKVCGSLMVPVSDSALSVWEAECIDFHHREAIAPALREKIREYQKRVDSLTEDHHLQLQQLEVEYYDEMISAQGELELLDDLSVHPLLYQPKE